MAQKISGNSSREVVIPSTIKRIRDFFGQQSGQHSLQPNTKAKLLMGMLSVGYLSVDCFGLMIVAHRGCDRTEVRLFIINNL